MPEWLYLLHPPRLTFAVDMTEAERAAMADHAERLKEEVDLGRVVIAGPVTDCTAPGIVVFEAADETAARAFMEQDPAVLAGVVTATLHPFRVSFLRGRRDEG